MVARRAPHVANGTLVDAKLQPLSRHDAQRLALHNVQRLMDIDDIGQLC